MTKTNDTMALDEAIATLRSMRRLKPDPVPEADLHAIVESATRAPSGGNIQNWSFIVVTEAKQRQRMGVVYSEVGAEYMAQFFAGEDDVEEMDPQQRKMYESSRHLIEHMSEAPAMIAACMRGRFPGKPESASAFYGSIYPAVQNMLLTARSRGLGTTLTTLHSHRQEAVQEILCLPENVHVICVIPVGYPEGNWGTPRRRPAAEVTHWNRWGNQRAEG